MLFWWPNSPYYWAGIYIGGINATCPPGTTANPNLNNAWIAEVTGTTGKNEHWDLAPIYVGLQAPCPNPHPPFSNFFSFDPQTAWNQGVAAAQDAISQYGGPILQLGTPPTYPTLIYFDLEGFNYTGIRHVMRYRGNKLPWRMDSLSSFCPSDIRCLWQFRIHHGYHARLSKHVFSTEPTGRHLAGRVWLA
jgi:hypothetical protein